VTPAV